VRAFLDLAGEFLTAREAEHNLIFGILSNLEADPSQYDAPPYLATITHGDRVVGAAIRTPPWRIVLSEMDHPGAVHRLVQDLAGEAIPGAVGPSDATTHFAEAWVEARHPGRPRLNRHERGFQLRRVIEPTPTTGEMVIAGPEHRQLLEHWLEAFHEEATLANPRQDYGAMADRWIRRQGRTVYLWMDGGRPVSLTGAGGLTPNGIRVGPVYTPRADRGHGYASNLVAQVSQAMLDSGRTYVFLFTDLANPTSNHIYAEIGYEPVRDVSVVRFG
jgi:predicted GNAT family acetyltransferase